MKKFLAFLLVGFLFSCNTNPDNVIHDQKSEKGGWFVDSGMSKPVQQSIEYVQIAPTWGQAFEYADKRSDRVVKVFVSIVFLGIFLLLFVGKTVEASWFPKSLQNMLIFNSLLFFSIVAAVAFFVSDASGVKFNNNKWVEKSEYEKVMQEAGSTQPIWDSLENNCLIVDGPYDCYVK